jgi:hypothetical protein
MKEFSPTNMPRTIEIPNGQKVVATFTTQELANRLAKLRAHMASANVDAVVMTSQISFTAVLVVTTVWL